MRDTERDREMLPWINGFGWALILQIAKWMGVDFSTAARRVRLLEKAGLIRRVKLQSMNVRPIILTPLGCAVSKDELPPLKGIRVGEFRHDGLMPDVARELSSKFPGSTFETARRIKFRDGTGGKHLPDGYLHCANGDRIIVEVELTLKSPRRIASILADHVSDLTARQVWYVTDNSMVAAAIERASAGFDHVRIVRLTKPKASSESSVANDEAGEDS